MPVDSLLINKIKIMKNLINYLNENNIKYREMINVGKYIVTKDKKGYHVLDTVDLDHYLSEDYEALVDDLLNDTPLC